MTAESVVEMARKLFEKEEFIMSHSQQKGKDRVFDDKEIPVLEAIAAIPSFSSFNEDQQRVAFRLGLWIASNVTSERMIGSCCPNRVRLKQELIAAFEAGSQLGEEKAQLVLEQAFDAALVAWGVK